MEDGTLYEIFFRESSTVMLIIDPFSGMIVDANNSAVKFYGYPYSKLLKMQIFDINTLSKDEIKYAMNKVTSGEINRYNFKHRLSNGDIRDVSVETNSVTLNDRNYICSIIRDISETLHLENELKLSEIRFRSYIEKSPIAIFIVNYKGYIDYANPAAVKLLADGDNITGIKPGKYGAGENEIRKAVFYSELINLEKEVFFEYNIINGIGNPVYLIVKAVRLSRDENILFCIDITERKKYELLLIEEKKRAENASNAKSDFLSNVSHELKTPLNGILGFSELLNLMETDPEKRDMLSLIIESGETLNNLVNDVLNYAKIERENFDDKILSFSMREFLSGICKIFTLIAKNKGLGFIADIDDYIPDFVYWNKTILQQIIGNLLSNAIKYTEAGMITFSVRKKHLYNGGVNELIFKVTDTGIGIASDNLERIFDRFEREKNELTIKYSGLGLGLPIVKSLVQKSGGKIEVESRKGIGSSFTVTLCFDSALYEKTAAPVINIIDKGVAEYRILIADDDKSCRYMLEKIITSRGWTADIVDDGIKVLEAVNSSEYDVILLDINMPFLNGVETAKKLRDIGVKTPMIALTAYSSSNDFTDWQQSGIDCFLSKPISRDVLYNTIESILDRRIV